VSIYLLRAVKTVNGVGWEVGENIRCPGIEGRRVSPHTSRGGRNSTFSPLSRIENFVFNSNYTKEAKDVN